MKPAELRAMSDEQLGLTLKEQVKALFDLRCRAAAERQNTPTEIRKTRRDIARILTLQRERQLVSQKKTQGK